MSGKWNKEDGHGVQRDLRAWCEDCGAGDWTAPNAQGVAARHAQVHGHRTVVEVSMVITYGPWVRKGDPEPAQAIEEPTASPEAEPTFLEKLANLEVDGEPVVKSVSPAGGVQGQ